LPCLQPKSGLSVAQAASERKLETHRIAQESDSRLRTTPGKFTPAAGQLTTSNASRKACPPRCVNRSCGRAVACWPGNPPCRAVYPRPARRAAPARLPQACGRLRLGQTSALAAVRHDEVRKALPDVAQTSTHSCKPLPTACSSDSAYLSTTAGKHVARRQATCLTIPDD